ncbi:MAG: hypothetical protein LBK28_02095, partial [Propionibacteriaceae bacterium]|nr:hypothetical protein [Propionibacteriaceae bacterium]
MSTKLKVVLTSKSIPLLESDQDYFRGLDVALVQTDGSNQAKLLEATRDADALLVVHEQIDRAVIEN